MASFPVCRLLPLPRLRPPPPSWTPYQWHLRTPISASPRASAGEGGGAPEKPKPARRGRKKATTSSPPVKKATTSATRGRKPKAPAQEEAAAMAEAEPEMAIALPSSSPPVKKATTSATRGRKPKAPAEEEAAAMAEAEPETTMALPSSSPPVKKATTSATRGRKPKAPAEEEAAAMAEAEPEMAMAPPAPAPAPAGAGTQSEEEEDDFDDGMDFPYEWPPLVCCFGAAQREFVPTVRVSDRQMHPDQYSSWKGLQWNPPEFARAPGGPPSNVAIAHARLGGRAAFMGKVGDDDYGDDLVYKMNLERVQTRAVRIDPAVKTAAARMRVRFADGDDGRLVAETSRECAEDSLQRSELDVSVLKEARIFHFNSGVLLSPSVYPALLRAIKLSKKYGSAVFFDLNLPLQLWKSREVTWEAIQKAWSKADFIEVSKQELEFLVDEEYYEKRRNYKPQYYSESIEQAKGQRDYYHHTREEISPLWHDGIKILFVTDGTLRIHYYTPEFDGVVVGTEDVLVAPLTCDRTGSGDALVAGIMRKLTIHPEICSDQDLLERHLRFAIAAGIISQWTIGAVGGFPAKYPLRI